MERSEYLVNFLDLSMHLVVLRRDIHTKTVSKGSLFSDRTDLIGELVGRKRTIEQSLPNINGGMQRGDRLESLLFRCLQEMVPALRSRSLFGRRTAIEKT